jgi:hypothetical protein
MNGIPILFRRMRWNLPAVAVDAVGARGMLRLMGRRPHRRLPLMVRIRSTNFLRRRLLCFAGS